MHEPLPASRNSPFEGAATFSFANRVERALFAIVWILLARWNPRALFLGWRRLLLRLFGARIAEGCVIYPDVRIWLPRNLVMHRQSTLASGVDCYNMAPITIGERVIVSQRAFLCTGSHDHRDPHFQLVAYPITIDRMAWIAAEAFVGPGVTIGEGAVLAARGCAARDLDAWGIYAGNPACKVGERTLSCEA